jgi:MinD-like ATPase involved in chromosome partitioning or flagellar assembly
LAARIISIHSFRGGTGKSNTTANVAAILARRGRRVGVIDTDIQSPGIHVILGVPADEVKASLNDFLWHNRPIQEVAEDVTPRLDPGLTGRVYLIPSSMQPGEIARVLREGYDAQRLTAGIRDLIDAFELDALLIDTHPGLNEETLLSLVISHALVIVMRPDRQDYEGTGVTVRVAQELQVPEIVIVVNKVPEELDPAAVADHVSRTYGCEVAAVMPHSNELMSLASERVFSLAYPGHPITSLYEQIAARVADQGR